MRRIVLGVKIDDVSKEEAVSRILKHIHSGTGLLHVVTAYSEFFVTATKDEKFRRVLAKAELVVPDGIGPLAAMQYLNSVEKSTLTIIKLFKGVVTGTKILLHKVGEPVSGVWLFCELVKIAASKDLKIYLLGGFGDTVYNLKTKLKTKYPNLKIECEAGDQEVGVSTNSGETLQRINTFKPDILFVAYGPVKQEKWIAENKKKLEVKVAVGVGGTFDEMTGMVAPAPKIMEKMGLKWLWRLLMEPKRFSRILKAFPIFPLMVFFDSIKTISNTPKYKDIYQHGIL